MVYLTSTISTSMAIPRPTKVAINTPPRDRSVIPSESSRTGHKLLRVLFQYFPTKDEMIIIALIIQKKTINHIYIMNSLKIIYYELIEYLTKFQNNDPFVVQE